MTLDNRSNFTLQRPSRTLDRRVNAARRDLADVALAGKIFVPHYAAPTTKSVVLSHAGVFRKPESGATMESELLAGERFAVLDDAGGWSWGYCEHDHYVGYVRSEALGEATPPITPLAITDWVQSALDWVGAPYLWGGRSRAGVDCSGLVQTSLAHAHIMAPRDADQQLDALGHRLDTDETLERGDLIFFPHHVGIMIDSANMVHATGFHGKVVIEPLAVVSARIAEKYPVAVLARKRLG